MSSEDLKILPRQLGGIAARLTGDADLQKDILQEMSVHWLRIQRDAPGHTAAWFLKSCEFHARNYLKLGRSVDSRRRACNLVSLDTGLMPSNEDLTFCGAATSPLDHQSELVIQDILDLVASKLSKKEKTVFNLLMRGYGIREAARQLGVSHPAVIKHRNKIAHITRVILDEPSGFPPAMTSAQGVH